MSEASARQLNLIARPRILVTGFDVFPGVPDNPSARLARSLPCRIMGLKVHRRVLPVSWARSTPMLARAVDRVVPHFVLMLGVAQQEATGRLETQALNRLDGRPDGDGELLLPGPIAPTRGMDHALRCHWPIDQIVRTLHVKGHHIERSDDAGRYLCNHTYYNAFDVPASAGVGFLHIRSGAYQGVNDPRRRLLLDVIRALDLWLRT